MKTARIGLIGVVVAVAAGLGLGGCFTKQPPPECSVQTSTYWVQLKETSRTAGCAAGFGYEAMQLGMQRFHPPLTQDFRSGLKPSILADMVNGVDVDPVSGLPSSPWGTTARTDPDPDAGKYMLAEAKLDAFPTNGKCKLTSFTGSDGTGEGNVQHFAYEDPYPATTVKLEWSDFNVYSTTRVPGTAFGAKMKYSESASNCTIEYTANGFWPVLGCTKDEDCNPDENPDGGLYDGGPADPTYVGSGLPPTWGGGPYNKPHCNHTQGVCEPYPGVDLSTLQ